ncbi:hypothetical protein HBA97_07705 [Mycobacteroides chelonae]|uniref:Uncharacterized protein n=1 Tax=Mycobacteroides chelonae TaxID=1774 RepID=A0A1S1M357_MYCCH|nr:hypothetical protein [Mycobacteroides chelonae]OHU77716.1 hypothetical protein BKG84_04195 [Mycobacteroides chelonae]QQG87123.1 hypothetical protein HBA99_07705 [Mycobacteroides chelonae]QQG91938.1 hypothetical protein HBA97_07705 [Mycobacteroides chelonae]
MPRFPDMPTACTALGCSGQLDAMDRGFQPVVRGVGRALARQMPTDRRPPRARMWHGFGRVDA